MKTIVVVAWHNLQQITDFKTAWGVSTGDPRIHFQQDPNREGCARTKNKGIAAALAQGAEVIIVLDDDCFPVGRFCEMPGMASGTDALQEFVSAHLIALAPQPLEMFEQITSPPSRGTPYFNRTITMPVAASLGFWTQIGDYDAPGQLVNGATMPMLFKQKTLFGKYFPFSGMNFAFRREWADVVQLVDLPRWDDIFMGYIFQKIAYSRGYCFNLAGPLVRHSRQSNVWQNLRDEALYMEGNETLWQEIALYDSLDPIVLRRLLPLQSQTADQNSKIAA